jgi:hypothetical protein
MSAALKLKWPAVFSCLKGAIWANFPNEISAGITLAAVVATVAARIFATHAVDPLVRASSFTDHIS